MKRRAAIALGMIVACCRCALGLNPSLDISQYAHNAWLFREGFPTGIIASMTQTPDGYLWFGTEFGLWRFDGVRPARWHPPGADRLPDDRIDTLLAARDGTLWIGWNAGLSSWNGARLIRYPEFDGNHVFALLEDREGTVWVGIRAGESGRLCAVRNGKTRCFGENGELGRVYSLYEDAAGSVWAGSDSGLWRWNPGPPVRYAEFAQPEAPLNLNAPAGGPLLIATSRRLLQLVEGRISEYPVLGRGKSLPAFRFLRDRDGGTWIGSSGQGLYRICRGRTDAFSVSDGLSSDSIQSLFEDREGNVWVATYRGIDRFREFSVSTAARKQGFSNDHAQSVLAAKEGAVWLAGSSAVDRWDDGKITAFGPSAGIAAFVHTLFQDAAGRIWAFSDRGTAYFENGRFFPVKPPDVGFVYSMAEDKRGDFWLATERGLLRWQPGQQGELTPWSRVGQPRGATELLADPERGGVWVGGLTGLVYTIDGRAGESFTAAEGLGEGRVSNLQFDGNGTLWAATAGGLSAIRQGRIATLNSRNGLPCDSVYWKMEDDEGATWLDTACGLIRIPPGELKAWAAGRKNAVQTTTFQETEGVVSHAVAFGYGPRAAKAKDGRIWFASPDGVGVIDPRHLALNQLPPPVHIEEIVGDEQTVWRKEISVSSGNLRLPALTHRLEIRYTALSLVAPEKIHFKYKLEGYDRDWMETINKRDVTYTNLPPRNYRFRVMAANNSGVWSEAGDTLEFSIAPAYYQTNWFLALAAATVLAMMWALYQFRVWQVQRESRRLRDVIETIPAYVWSALPDGFVDFINRRWLEFSGFSLDQAKGWGWADAVHPEDRDRLVEAFRGSLASGKPLEAEARMRGADGQYRWLLFRSVPQRDGSGKIVKWYGKSMDIDDRKRAEETVRETESRFRTYIDHATDAFFVLDFQGGTILDANRQACENLGYTREELIGKTVFDFDAALDAESLNQSIRPRIEAGESVTFETRHRRKDGSVFPVEIRARAFRSGGRTFNLSLALDITERKRSEEERERLRQIEADLAHINRVSMMGELAASIAHEVNQPLTGIVSNGSACLRFLAGDEPNLEEIREAVGDMVRDGKRAGEVIARIRALTKRAAPPREKLNLNETVREVLSLVGDEAKRKSVAIRTQFAEDLAPVSGDRVQLQQVLLNLMMNAMDAMSGVVDRQRQLVIRTQNIGDQDRVQVTVEDSGTGLDPKTAARIFDAFYTTKSGGMGMGLSICRSIVQNHGGRLWATPNDGPGTSFHFALPSEHGETSRAGIAGV